jgi:hypothetical protein
MCAKTRFGSTFFKGGKGVKLDLDPLRQSLWTFFKGGKGG